MELTENAEKNLEKFLPYLNSTIDKTDPEFSQIIKNFIFDEVQENTILNEKTEILVVLASIITNQSIKLYEVALEAALNIGVSPIEIKEVLYQSTAYIGLTKSYDFLDLTNDIFDEKGIDVPIPGQSTTNLRNRKEKGYEIQYDFFGKENIDKMNEDSSVDTKHFNDFLSGYCFGDFYTRTGLTKKNREIITFSILVTLSGCENQLRGHISANLNVGNNRETLIGVLTSIMSLIGFPKILNAINIINEICPVDK